MVCSPCCSEYSCICLLGGSKLVPFYCMYSWFLLLAVVLEGHYKDWINGYSTTAPRQVCARIHIYTHVTYIRILNYKKPFPLVDLFFSYKEKMRFWSVEWLAWVGIQIHPAGPRARTSFTALPCPHSLHPLRELDWVQPVSFDLYWNKCIRRLKFLLLHTSTNNHKSATSIDFGV